MSAPAFQSTNVLLSSHQEERLIVAMCGLPARGKTFISERILRYLTWLSIPTKSFNIDNYRRQIAEDQRVNENETPDTQEGREIREKACELAVQDLVTWICENNGRVGILDGPNVTKVQRRGLVNKMRLLGISVFFIESFIENQDYVGHLLKEVHKNSPAYRNQDPKTSRQDLDKVIEIYKSIYEPLDADSTENDYIYCKLINIDEEIIINNVCKYLESKIVYYTLSTQFRPRSILLSRHGESMYNIMGKIGGDSELSPRGREYAEALPNLIRGLVRDKKLTVWTSSMKRTIQTAEKLPYVKVEWKALDELDAGICDGLTYEEIEKLYPEDLARRDNDKFNARYQCGESYRDAIIRIEPVIMELERHENVLIICHQAIIRCIYGFYLNIPQEDLSFLDIPLHTIIKLIPRPYSISEEKISVPIEAVSTYRPRKVRKS